MGLGVGGTLGWAWKTSPVQTYRPREEHLVERMARGKVTWEMRLSGIFLLPLLGVIQWDICATWGGWELPP